MDDLDALLPAIIAGDTGAFGQFMAAVELAVRRSLKSFAARVDVEAVLQEAFLRIWQVAPRFVPDGRDNGLLRLLLRIARNLALDELKRRREEPAGFELDRAIEVRATTMRPDPLLRELIVICFERLPSKPSLAMRARLDNDGANPDSVLADRCSMKPNTFLQNVTRARKLLSDCLEAKGVRVSEASP